MLGSSEERHEVVQTYRPPCEFRTVNHRAPHVGRARVPGALPTPPVAETEDSHQSMIEIRGSAPTAGCCCTSASTATPRRRRPSDLPRIFARALNPAPLPIPLAIGELRPPLRFTGTLFSTEPDQHPVAVTVASWTVAESGLVRGDLAAATRSAATPDPTLRDSAASHPIVGDRGSAGVPPLSLLRGVASALTARSTLMARVATSAVPT